MRENSFKRFNAIYTRMRGITGRRIAYKIAALMA